MPAAYNPDGALIAVSNETSIYIWHVASRQRVGEIEVRSSPGLLHFSPDGESLWTARSGNLSQWEVAGGKLLRTLSTASRSVVAFSPDGRAIVSGGLDRVIRIWDTSKTNPEQVVTNTHGWIYSLRFSPDGRRFASGGAGGSLRIHDAASGMELKTVGELKGSVEEIGFSADGKLLAASVGSAIKLWDAETFEERAVLLGHDRDISSLQFAPDGRTIVSGDANGVIKFWSTDQSPDPQVLRGHTGALREVAFSPDGRRLVSSSLDGTLRVWALSTGEEILSLKGHRGTTPATAFSPDGTQIVSGGMDRTVRLWDAATGALTKTLRGHTDGLYWVNFSPDGKRVISGGSGGQLKLWDVASGTELRTFADDASAVEGAQFTPDGKFVATCERTASGLVKLWAAATGELVKTFSGPKASYRCVAFSPDGRSLAVGVNSPGAASAVIWDVTTGELRALKGSGGRILTVGFSADGRRLFGAGDRGVISVWDTGNGDQLLTFDAQQSSIWCVKISPDGNTLASSGENGVIQLWETVQTSDDVHRQRRLTTTARRIVDERAQTLPFAADLILSLQADATLEPARREAAIRLATNRGDNPSALFAACQGVLVKSNASADALALALRQADTAAAILNDDAVISWTLGFAQFRAGKFTQALAAAERSNKLALAQSGTDHPAALLVQAMAHFRLGNVEKARSILAQAKALPASREDNETDRAAITQLAEQLIR